jgi:hypothetical protein
LIISSLPSLSFNVMFTVVAIIKYKKIIYRLEIYFCEFQSNLNPLRIKSNTFEKTNRKIYNPF